MSFVLMVVGILATAVGVILIGFGIPINEFSLGNTLIVAGTTTLIGGLVIFALSRAVSQLTRIADAIISGGPVGSPTPSASDPYHSQQHDQGRQGSNPRQPPPRGRQEPAARGQEPRLQPAEFELPEQVEPVRPPPGPGSRTGEQPLVDESDDLPLSPRGPARSAPGSDNQPTGWRPPRPSPELRPRKPAASEPQRRPAPHERSADNPFDAAWPAERPGARPDPSPRPPVSRREPALEPLPEAAAESSRPEPVSVLKSGVVDGMAYTLYTDGSIEAELAQGVVRFGSIEELRNHLEKSA